ncbi:SDR family NAD(P)-dependent oxidoreductase [Tropicibacter sp. R16_0]|uniref:SDR family NAD(P)-dependent oxidoreductase n=1 Tax=Tropicibacter sp. R16_0 TaxID=2821102 RepID=UPI001ADCFFA4|nr:SDR family NAD(P)-dependent oxidoreductase [Tropicibacter sp. R16_0]MBO9451153.1 SDR family NAD(P)-dependent oxidoreductase [Tropicibacter sp. R16_0]
MSKVAIVTGANQGLGFALTKGLANRLTADDFVYLTARSEERGRAALQSLGKTRAQVEFAQLDVTDPGSVTELATHLKAQHGGVDIVASNAAARITKDRPQSEQVQAFIATNNHGSRAMYGALADLLRPNARYVMVASSFGQLRNLPPHLHPLFDTDAMSLDDIEASMDRYVNAMEAGTAEKEGWPGWINIPSKIGQVATARIAARDLARIRPNGGILINAVCPGLLDTEASRPWFDSMENAMSPDEGAAPIIDLLLAPANASQPSGQLVRFGRVLPWM